MAAILPFAQALPQELQVPSLQPQFGEIQSIAQRANNIFETGVNHVKNAYSSVINAPVTDTRNIEKKQEYVQNFRDGLKKITKENVTMPQNVLQAENLLSPFWQDDIMLRDMSFTTQAQEGYSAYNQALNSTDDKVRITANSDYLKLLNHSVERLRRANGDPNFYNSFSIPKYQPYGDVDGHMTKWKIDDAGKSDIVYEVDYETDPLTDLPVLDKNGQKKPLPNHAIMKVTNGMQTKVAKTHQAAAVLGNGFNSNYEIRAKNSYNDTFDTIRQRYLDLPDNEITKLVNSQYHNDILANIDSQRNLYKAASDDAQSQIDTLTKQQNTSHGLTPDQEAYLNRIKLVKKDADNRYADAVDRFNKVSSPEVRNRVTEGYVVNQLSDVYKQQDIDKWGTEWSINSTKHEVVENKNYYNNVQHTDRIREQNIQTAHYRALESHNTNEEFLSAMQIAAKNPAMAAALRQYGYNIPEMAAGYSAGMIGGEIEGAGTADLQYVDDAKIYAQNRERTERVAADNFYSLPTITNPTGGIINALRGKYGLTPGEFSTLQKYQYNAQIHNDIIYNDDGSIRFKGVTKGTDGMLKDEREYKSAIAKIARGMGISPSTIKTPGDFTHMMINNLSNDIKTWGALGVKQEDINKYVTTFTAARTAYESVEDADRKQEQKARELADQNPDIFQDAMIYDPRIGKHRMINESDIDPFAFSVEGIGKDGRHYTFSRDMIRRKILEGNVEYVESDNKEIPGSSYKAIRIDGVDIDPTKIDGRDYQQEFDIQHPSKFGHWFYSNEHGTNPRALGDVRNRLYAANQHLGKQLTRVGASRRNLYRYSIPDTEFYKKQTGEVPIIKSYPIIGKDDQGNDYSTNFNTISHAISTGNRLSIEDERGEPITDDGVLNKLVELAGLTGPDAYKYIGKDFKQIVAADNTPQKLAIKFNTDEETKKRFEGLEGKKFYIDISPTTESRRLQSLPRGMGREPYDNAYSDNPDINRIEANELQIAGGVNGNALYNPSTKMWDIVWEHPIIDEKGVKQMNYQSISIPDKGVAAAKATLNAYLNRGIQAYTASQVIYNTRNGNKVKGR